MTASRRQSICGSDACATSLPWTERGHNSWRLEVDACALFPSWFVPLARLIAQTTLPQRNAFARAGMGIGGKMECPIDALYLCHTFFHEEYNWSERTSTLSAALRTITHHLTLRRGFIISTIPDYQMTPIVDPSWPRMSSNMENPFQNVPGPFIYALPDLRSFGPSISRVHSTTVPSTPALPRSPLEGQVASFPCDESAFDHDGCPNTMQGESEPELKEGDAYSELDAKTQSDSRTCTPSPLSPTSSISSGQERTTEKTKRSRRRRRRNRQVVDVGGCVMGPRMVFLPLDVPYWSQSRTPGIVPPNPWSPGYPVAGGDRLFNLQTVPGY